MPTNFNPYAQWLGLNPKILNPHHFQLLGVSTKITDPAELERAVEAGAKRNLLLLDKIPAGEHDAVIKQIKQRVLIARKTLLDSDARQVYLSELKQRTKAQQSGALTVSPAVAPGDLLPPAQSPPAPVLSPLAEAPSEPETADSDSAPPSPADASFTATAPRKSVFTPPTIGEPPAPVANNAVPINQPIPMAVPLSPSAQPAVASAIEPTASGVAVNSDGVPIDEVKIQKKAVPRKKKSNVGLIAGASMLVAALAGGALIYLNLDALLGLAGVDPEVVPAAPGIIKEKDGRQVKDDTPPSIPAATDNDSNKNSETESRPLPSLDMDALPELNINDVIGDPETKMVTGRDAKTQKALDEENQARRKAMGLDDFPESANPESEKPNTKPIQPGLENGTDNSPLGEIVGFNELQLAQYRRQLERARRSLFRRDKGTALKSIERANRILDEVRPDESARFNVEQAPIAALAEESKEIYDLIEGFWNQVVASCETIAGGQEIVASGQTIGFVEADLDKFIVRHAGSNITYEYYFCPPALAVELANQGAISDIPTWNKQLAAFYAVNQVDGVDHLAKIDELLKVCEEAGHECDGIRHFAEFEFGEFGKPPEKIEMPNRKAFNEGIAEFRSENDYADVDKLAQGTAAMFGELLLQIDSPNFEQHVVLLEEARRLGIRSGESAITEDAIIELNNFAEIDQANLMCDSYLELAANELTISQRRALMEQAIVFLKSPLAESAKLKSRQQLVKKLTDIAVAYGMADAARRISQLN